MKDVLRDYLLQYGELSGDVVDEILEAVKVIEVPKNNVLIHQGQVPQKCYFILKGILRKHQITQDGEDLTVEFYNEGQSVNIFYGKDGGLKSPYAVTTIEDAVLIEGDLNGDEVSEANPFLNEMMQSMVLDITDDINETLAVLVRLTPEEKVKYIQDMRPYLLTRVPQHQLASYLGITPESLSRIKKRLAI